MTTVSLAPASVRWTIYQGATFKQQITVLSAGQGSSPVDLTSYTGVPGLIVRANKGGLTLLTLTSGNGGLILGGNLGTITIIIASTVTAALPWKTAVFDLLITEPDGITVDSLLTGNFSVTGYIS